MPFVKLDCSMLHSSIWPDKDARDLFITALLMAEPIEIIKESPQIFANSLELTGWKVPPGWYGFVPAAGIGIAHQAGLHDKENALAALIRLGSPENESRSPAFEGRRMVRIDGGYLILNYMAYRERDYTSADRSRRYRDRKAKLASRRDVNTSSRESVTASRDITQAEGEAEGEAENEKISAAPLSDSPTKKNKVSIIDQFSQFPGLAKFWSKYPSTGKARSSRSQCLLKWEKNLCEESAETILDALEKWKQSDKWTDKDGQYVEGAHLWIENQKWLDVPKPQPRQDEEEIGMDPEFYAAYIATYGPLPSSDSQYNDPIIARARDRRLADEAAVAAAAKKAKENGAHV